VGGTIGGEKPKVVKQQSSPVKTAPTTRRTQINRSEIDESLRGIDDESNQEKKSRRKNSGQHTGRRKWESE
jgi:hypothetical protein